ncbi:MAG TPA: glycoside hydrolase family 78 protein [Prolixibacteraceae bacterium]|jgi:alpha-L-rhamnosidase
MKNIVLIIFSIFFLCFGVSGQNRPENLKCEYLVNPIGIDATNPRLIWQMKTEQQGAFQKAYKIFFGTDSAKVANSKGDFWDSGEVNSSLMLVIFQGQKLVPFTRYFWGVKVQDQEGKWSDLSTVAFFETGMMNQENWKGDWITDSPDFNIKPAPYFRKAFEIAKKVKSARAYIAVAGLYELYLNGEKVGDHRLDPMYTRFDRRTLYVTYDVTQSVLKGENAIGVNLGNGWYNHQSMAVWYFDKAPWRARPKFCMNLRLVYEDGTEETINTGQDWKTALSPITLNSIYTAEHYDARLEQPGWDKAGFDDSQWRNAMSTGMPSQNITTQALHPIRNVERIPAKEMIQLNDSTYIYKFGRNFSGVNQISVSGAAGTTIRLKHGERLGKDGRVSQLNIDEHYRPTDDSDPFMTDIFILNGKGQETFMPRFNYKGFQYVEVTSNKPINLNKESLTAYFMHSDVPAAGSIHSSNPTLNKIWEATNASYLSNLFGYPTDCPQREKNGWTGDAHINIETGLYNYDAITIYEKWMADHQDEQQPNGVLPAIIPTDGWGFHWANGPDWTSTIAIIPWNIYLFYGDSHLLESCYCNIKRYVDHIDEMSPSGLTDWGLGDWVPVKSETPREFTSSSYFYIDATILAKAAKILGKQTDYAKYSALAGKIKQAINAKYLNTETGIYGSGFQTELSFALKWDLVPEELRAKVARNLAERVFADGSHIDVGLLGSKTILNALSENGYSDLAYQVALQETYPSWGNWIVNGATTLFEHWTIDTPKDISSMNHIMFGEIGAWFYKALGGIFPDEAQPGFKNIILKPNFVSGLNQFEAKYDSPYGTIVSSWEKSKGKILYQVTIPANSTATLYLNAKKVTQSGKDLSENKLIRTEKNKDQLLCMHLQAGNYKFLVITQ